MKVLLVLASTWAVALAAAPTASAKGCVRIDVPAVAVVGEHLRITIRTYESIVDNGKVVPGAPTYLAIPRLDVVAEGPAGRTLKFRTRRLGRSAAGVARVVFPTRGLWRLRAANWKYAPRSCAPASVVRVR